MKKGSNIRTLKIILYIAMITGGALLQRMSMEAVETAAMLTNMARFGGNRGLSLILGYTVFMDLTSGIYLRKIRTNHSNF